MHTLLHCVLQFCHKVTNAKLKKDWEAGIKTEGEKNAKEKEFLSNQIQELQKELQGAMVSVSYICATLQYYGICYLWSNDA